MDIDYRDSIYTALRRAQDWAAQGCYSAAGWQLGFADGLLSAGQYRPDREVVEAWLRACRHAVARMEIRAGRTA